MKLSVWTYFFLICVISCIGVACKENTPKKTSPKDALPTRTLPLSEENIYNAYRIKKAREIATTSDKSLSKEKFAVAMQAIQNGQIQKGLDTLVASLTYYPNALTYFELGNVLMQSEEYEEATNAYETAKHLDYQYLKYLYYNVSCAYAMDNSDLDGKRRSINYLRLAMQNGYTNKDSFLTDTRLENIRYMYDYNKIYLETFTENEGSQCVERFELFTHLFPKADFPVEIDPEDLDKSLNKKRRLYEPLISFINRVEYMPDKEHYIAVALLKQTEKYTAVLCLAYPIDPKTRLYRHYDLITYTPKGKIIDRLRFADSTDPEKYISGNINRDLNITVNTHLNIWKNNLQKQGYRNNYIEYSDFLFAEKYTISKRGRLVKMDSDQ